MVVEVEGCRDKMKKLFDKFMTIYGNLSAPVKASLWFTICNILQKGISLLSTPIFTRLLTKEQYGVFSVYNSWYSIISILATLNLYAGVYNNGMTKYPKDRKRFTSSLQGLSTCVTTILLLIYLLNVNYWNSLLKLSTLFVIAMFLELYFAPAFSFWSVGERYDYKYKKLVIVTLIMSVGTPIIGIIAVLSTTYKAEARVLSYVLVQVCVGLIFYIYNMSKGKTFYVKKYWRFALSFNLPLIPHYLSMTVLNQADRIMISRMIGDGEAAIYSVAYTVSSMMNIVTTAINNSFIPYTYKGLKEKKYKDIGRNANFLLIIIAVACVLAMAFGPEIIAIFATEEYYDAIWVIPPVATSVFFTFLYPLFGNIEFYFEKTKFIMIASCTGAVLNVILNYIFIPIFGYYAAGYTTLFCYIIFAVAHYAFHNKILKDNLDGVKVYDVKVIVLVSIIVLFVMIGMTMTYKYIILRYSIILAILIVMIIKRKLLISKFNEIRKK